MSHENAQEAVSCVAILPARYASERLPGKPLAMIAGKPMIQHVYERTRRARLVDEVLVATDDERIAAAVREFGGTAIMTPDGLASGTDRIAYVARALPRADIIVNVQGDEPLIVPAMIDEAIGPVLRDTSLLAATLVRPISSADDLANPSVPKVVLARNGDCLYFSRSAIPFAREPGPSGWLGAAPYYLHVGLYVFRRDFLLLYASLPQTPLEKAEKLEQLRILEHGYSIRGIITGHESLSVDTADDLARVRAILEAQP